MRTRNDQIPITIIEVLVNIKFHMVIEEIGSELFLPGIAINQPVDQKTARLQQGIERKRKGADAVEVNPQSLSRLSTRNSRSKATEDEIEKRFDKFFGNRQQQ